jgi:hypothetical protein
MYVTSLVTTNRKRKNWLLIFVLWHTLHQWFSTFVRPRPGNFFFIRQGPGIFDARVWHQAAAWRLRNTALHPDFWDVWGSYIYLFIWYCRLDYPSTLTQKRAWNGGWHCEISLFYHCKVFFFKWSTVLEHGILYHIRCDSSINTT